MSGSPAVVVLDDDGAQRWSTAFAVAQLGVNRKTVNDWVRRSRAAGHTQARPCPRCVSGEPGFPHVDPPARAGRWAGYVAEQLLEAEAYTVDSPRTGRRRPAQGAGL